MGRITSFPPVVRAIAWMVFAGASYVSSGALVRFIADGFSPFQLVFLRGVVAMLFLAPMFWRTGIAGLRTTQFRLHCGRSFLTYSGLLLWFYSVTVIPLADYYALLFTLPLFTIAGAVLFLGERAGPRTWVATTVGFIGALVILRPGFVEVSLGAVAALGAGLSYAGVNTCTRVLARKDSATVIVAYVNFLVLLLALVPALMTWSTPGTTDLLVIVGIGVVSTIGQIALTRAIALAEARVIQPFDFLRLPLAALFGYVLFAELPDLWTWVGAIIIFASAYYVLSRETRPATS